MKRYGHIKLSRKAFDPVDGDVFWHESRTYSRWEAWVSLIQLAQWQKSHTLRTKYGPVTLTRGEFVASLRHLAKAWKWGKDRVAAFFRECEKSGRIARQREGHAGNVYLIVNYDTYQSAGESGETLNQTDKQTKARQTPDKNKQLSKISKLPEAENAGDDESLPTNLGWVAVLGDAWKEITGGLPKYAKLGAQLGSVVAAYGIERVEPAWRKFCASEQRRYGASYFSEHFGDFEIKLVSGLDEAAILDALGIH